MEKQKYLGKLNLEDNKVKERIGKGKILTHISLFTGCGGLDLGFSQAGIQTRVMIEFAHSPCETLRNNWLWEFLKKRKDDRGNPKWKSREELIKKAKEFRRKQEELDKKDDFGEYISRGVESWYHYPEPVIIEKDIKEVTTKEILKSAKLEVGQCSIISGGFPCQGFSLAGKRIINDPRNFLYKEFVRIVDEAKPVFIFGENVLGIVSMGKGEVIKQICEDFANCGYDITWDILDAANYGVPQHRKRVILIGKRIDLMRVDVKGKLSFHIGAMPGEVTYPKLFYERLKRWKNKKLLSEIEKKEVRNSSHA